MIDLANLLVHAEKSDVVIGYRRRRAEGGIRQFNSSSWKWLIRCLMGLKVRDLDCAFKLFPRWVVECLQMQSEGACISAEIMAQCMRGGVSITEVPVNHYPRSAGKATGANLKVVLKAFRELPVVWQYRKMEPWLPERRLVEASNAQFRTRRNRSAQISPALVGKPGAADLPLSVLGDR